ncbi:hypothetical protein C1646_761422 [Rhizophagus diaphanus]|nr:hypothetical protein C1646_761422 [Rhizophagus diaphanus] [Rhizophagus sp. MUCL 43196]
MSGTDDDIQVVVAIGDAYAHKSKPDKIIVQVSWKYDQDSWKEYYSFKTPTVVKYKDNYSQIESWGYPALTEKPKSSRLPKSSSTPIELFKLHLLKSIKESEKPILPINLNYKKVIRDFMEKLGDDIKTILKKSWQNWILKKILILLIPKVPTEFDDEAIAIFRKCIFNAGLLNYKDRNNIRIITEPKAAAIHCLNSVEHNLTPGDSFMIVDCGGGTVDLTTCELLDDERLSELTVCTENCCGSRRIDEAFLEFVGEIVGKSAIESVRTNHYDQLQYCIQEFCRQVKIPFAGNDEDMQYEIDLEELLPAIINYVKGEEKERLECSEWGQLDKSEKKCSDIFLVGGFGEYKYLQYRIRREFCEISNISVPPHPIASVVKGGVLYGLINRLSLLSQNSKKSQDTVQLCRGLLLNKYKIIVEVQYISLKI